MSTEVARRSTPSMGLISRDALKQSLGHVAQSMPRVATGGIDYAKMSKRGVWTFGQDNTEVEDDDVWAVNPGSLQHGWIAWKEKMGQEPIGEEMGSAMRPLIDVNTLPKPSEGKGWQQQYSVELLCVSGPNQGAHILYKNTTVGAIKLFNVYIDELMTRVENDSDDLVALVHLSAESYDHKEWGETWNPVLEYIEWRDPEDVSPVEAAPKAEAPKAEAKAAPRTRKPAAEKAPETEQAAPGGEDADGEPVQEDGEDDDDFAIRMIVWKKAQKAKATAAPAAEETAAEQTPRRRERRAAA